MIRGTHERFLLNPKVFEDIVGSIFADHGFTVRVTSYSGDDGIDVILLDGQDNAEVGVQVKRYRGKIEAEQIRSLAGALALSEMPKGVFVTTSTFTRGAKLTADRFLELGVPIELVDGQVPSGHLRSLGFREWPRARFLAALRDARERPTRPGPWRLDGPEE